VKNHRPFLFNQAISLGIYFHQDKNQGEIKMKKAELVNKLAEIKESLEEEIKFFRNALENKDIKGSLRQYTLGRLTSLECIYEKL